MKLKNKSVLEDTKQTAIQQLIEKLKMDIDYYDSLLSQEDYKAYHKGLSAKKTQAKSTLDDAESLLHIEQERMYSEDEVVSILEFARKNYYDIGEKWHQEPSIDLTSKELIKKYYEQ